MQFRIPKMWINNIVYHEVIKKGSTVPCRYLTMTWGIQVNGRTKLGTWDGCVVFVFKWKIKLRDLASV